MSLDWFSLEGKVALVTGSNTGIGAAIARGLARAGADVICHGREGEATAAVSAEIRALGRGSIAVTADLSDRAAQDDLVARAAGEFGRIDILINNAGMIRRAPAVDYTDDDWDLILEVNLSAPFRLARRVGKMMVERGGGRIVNVASGSAYLPPREGGSTAYPASKAAVHRFSEVLAASLTPKGVFVFSISPGLVRTAMTEGNFPDDAPWTPPECAPRLVHALAGGELDALAGRYLHAEHDPPDELRKRVEAIRADDLNAIRLRR